ncbi:MAG: hypothetical protein HC880_14900 [Bacteroidia bacterium]|nr:hypothetical protein [Bacteroidia bacterium]
MNLLTSLMLSQVQSLKKRHQPRTVAPNVKRIEKQKIDRALWEKQTCEGLKGQILSSIELGQIMGVSRMAAYRRLTNMEKQGIVERIGHNVKTKWRLKND